ncbi:uncharacterized protein LOC114166837 [Vigna unguiculata]|uniref:uncharacterized protein LOC114166837 n=1 Tax=Vigna unguiculata TaxID=3917 RepID=UPI0010169299|nr:uncharacterized protein LOC114166837 [Vigna unguiculata]
MWWSAILIRLYQFKVQGFWKKKINLQILVRDDVTLYGFASKHKCGEEYCWFGYNVENDHDAKLVLTSKSIQYGIGILQSIQNEPKRLKKSLKVVEVLMLACFEVLSLLNS